MAVRPRPRAPTPAPGGPTLAEHDPITVYVQTGDPASQSVLRYLDQRGLKYTVKDVLTDPGATAVLFGRLGRVVVPVVQVGDRLLVGSDPVQLARFLPRDEADQPHVSFGAAIRGMTPESASAAHLPATYGVEVGRVTPGSPADAAGVRAGDIITQIGAYTLQGGLTQFRQAVSARRPGDVMQIGVWRDGDTVALAVEFPVAPDAAPAGGAASAPPDS